MGKRSIIVSVLVVCLIAMSGVAFATDYAAARVVRVGPFYGQTFVQVEGDGLTGVTQFTLDPNKEDEQLAVFLTALSFQPSP